MSWFLQLFIRQKPQNTSAASLSKNQMPKTIGNALATHYFQNQPKEFKISILTINPHTTHIQLHLNIKHQCKQLELTLTLTHMLWAFVLKPLKSLTAPMKINPHPHMIKTFNIALFKISFGIQTKLEIYPLNSNSNDMEKFLLPSCWNLKHLLECNNLNHQHIPWF